MGEMDRRKKLSDADVRGLRALYATGTWTQVGLAKVFGVSAPQISLIVRGKSRV